MMIIKEKGWRDTAEPIPRRPRYESHQIRILRTQQEFYQRVQWKPHKN